MQFAAKIGAMSLENSCASRLPQKKIKRQKAKGKGQKCFGLRLWLALVISVVEQELFGRQKRPHHIFKGLLPHVALHVGRTLGCTAGPERFCGRLLFGVAWIPRVSGQEQMIENLGI